MAPVRGGQAVLAVLALLAFTIAPSAIGPAAATSAGAPPTESLDDVTNTTDGIGDGTNNTTDDAVDTTTNTTANTTSAVDDATASTNTTDETASTDAIDAMRTDGDSSLTGSMTETMNRTADTVENPAKTVESTTDTVADTTDAVENTTDTVQHTAMIDGEFVMDASLASPAGSTSNATGNGTAATDGSSADAAPTDSMETPTASTDGREPSDASTAADASAAPADRQIPFPTFPETTTTIAVASLAAVTAVARPPVRPAGVPALVRAGIAAHLPDRWLDKLPRFAVPLRYSRHDDSDPLAHDTRRTIYDVITDSPGIHLAELGDRADIPLSTVRYHVDILHREDLVCTAKPHGKRRLYPATTEDLELTAALADPATAAVLDALADHGEVPVSDLADDLGRDPSTVTHHLQRLATDGLVERERVGRAVVNRLTSAAEDALTASELDDRAPDDRKPAIADD